ncbi:MAG TPA: lysophospholipid acyltransferase family protein [Mariprofundaceae bacterium]|nr:lysophospholipid acyltransferase family protein [Mariprofundaceae bacterium]
MIARLRQIWRAGRIVVHILAAFPLAILFLPLKQKRHSAFQQRLIAWWLADLCRIMHVRMCIRGKPVSEPALLVANHISWLDIPLLASAWQGRFLSKADVAEWPVIGWLLRRTGTLLIRRGARRGAEQAIDDISRTLQNSESVCLFPEGTTTNGDRVLRFHPRLFQAACRTAALVQPVMLRYPEAAGLSATVPFIGDDEFVSHLLQLLRQPEIEAELVFLPALDAAGQLPDHLADAAHAMISWALNPRLVSKPAELPIITGSTGSDPRYHAVYTGNGPTLRQPAHADTPALN